MRPRLLAVVGMVWFVFGPAAASAQPPPKPTPVIETPADTVIQELKLADGSTLYGRVERIDGDTFVFRTVSGASLDVMKSQVAALAIAKGALVGSEFYPADSNTTRLFFAPTGRALRKGEGYFGIYQIFMPTLQVGITDRISIGGGTPLFFFGGDGDHPFWFTPKVQILDRGRTSIAAGVFHVANIGDEGPVGIAYSVVTHGTTDAAVTVGVGYGYRDGGGAPVIMIGGENRMSRRTKFVSENYWWSGGGILSGGVRFLGKGLSADLGLVAPINDELFIILPFVNFVWRFGG